MEGTSTAPEADSASEVVQSACWGVSPPLTGPSALWAPGTGTDGGVTSLRVCSEPEWVAVDAGMTGRQGIPVGSWSLPQPDRGHGGDRPPAGLGQPLGPDRAGLSRSGE